MFLILEMTVLDAGNGCRTWFWKKNT